jgi:hypothetical protein
MIRNECWLEALSSPIAGKLSLNMRSQKFRMEREKCHSRSFSKYFGKYNRIYSFGQINDFQNLNVTVFVDLISLGLAKCPLIPQQGFQLKPISEYTLFTKMG